MLGFNSCLFLHGKDTNRRLNWQTGAGIRFRGGNFANGDSGNTAYTRIGLISTDLPLLLNYRLGRPGHGYYKCLQFGVVGSFFLKSIVYQGYDKIPAQRENYLKTWKNLPLKPYDLQAVIGYQKRGQIVGWQMGFKLGIMNINQNFYLKDMIPVTGTGKKIATWNLDFSFLF